MYILYGYKRQRRLGSAFLVLRTQYLLLHENAPNEWIIRAGSSTDIGWMEQIWIYDYFWCSNRMEAYHLVKLLLGLHYRDRVVVHYKPWKGLRLYMYIYSNARRFSIAMEVYLMLLTTGMAVGLMVIFIRLMLFTHGNFRLILKKRGRWLLHLHLRVLNRFTKLE